VEPVVRLGVCHCLPLFGIGVIKFLLESHLTLALLVDVKFFLAVDIPRFDWTRDFPRLGVKTK